MIKAIIFDWGGVLIQNPSQGLIAYCANALGVTEKKFITEYRTYNQEFQKGFLSEDQLWENICASLHIEKPLIHSLWGSAFRAVYQEQNEMFSLASYLKKKGYNIGRLSNTEKPAMQFFFEQHYDMFDVTVFSCAEGTRKPEQKIYQHILEQLQVQPDDAVFIDDTPEYITGAKKIGIHTILFTGYSQVKKELQLLSVHAK
ncbi:MAG: HAD family phosphatase [Euryarchaeota archaeon]|nr:HAD family phosphatase [Euryarchaeota archaeon]